MEKEGGRDRRHTSSLHGRQSVSSMIEGLYSSNCLVCENLFLLNDSTDGFSNGSDDCADTTLLLTREPFQVYEASCEGEFVF